MRDKQLPDGWLRVRLGDVVDIRRDAFDPRNGKTMPYVALEHIDQGRPRLVGRGTSDETTSTKTRFRAGDVLFGKLRPHLRKSVRVDFDGVCSTDILAMCPKDGLLPEYLGQLAHWEPLEEHAIATSIGTKMPRTTWPALASFLVLLPPPPEQQRIAEVLDAIDAAIEKTEAVIAATERLRSALLGELLTRGVPGWHTEWKQVPGIGTIPACWEVVRLGDVADVIGGSTPSKNVRGYFGGDIPWATPTDITRLGGKRFIEDTVEFISDAGLRAAGLRLLPAGSILLTSRASIGEAAINLVPMTTNQGFQNLVPKNGTHALWLYYAVTNKRMLLNRLAAGSTFKEVSRASVRKLELAVPPLDEQRRIAEALDATDKAIDRQRAVAGEMSHVKRAVAEALLSGRIRVGGRGKDE